jgi:hypothetical protein
MQHKVKYLDDQFMDVIDVARKAFLKLVPNIKPKS